MSPDRAYNDYSPYHDWTRAGIYCVTRQKGNAVYELIENRPVPENRNILADQIIRFSGPVSARTCPVALRRIVVWDAKNRGEVVLLTNHLQFGATTIAAIYKGRWEIDVLFRTLKQNLKVKTFVGTTPNALRIQIWTALLPGALFITPETGDSA